MKSSAPKSALIQRLAFLSDLLIAPRSTDEDARRQEYVLNIILAACIAALLALEGLVLYHVSAQGGGHSDIPLPEFTILPVFFIFLLALSRKGHRTAASYLLIGTLTLANACVGLLWGADLPVTLLAYAFIISTAGILLGTASGFALTAIAALLIAATWSLHAHGIVIPRPRHPSQDDVIAFATFYALIMTVSWLSNREIGKSLARARRSEKALARERDLLEVRIAERTDALCRVQFEELEKAHRFAEFGRLASGLFHDLLNILNSISLAREGDPEDDPSFAAAYEITHQIRQFMRAAEHQLDEDERREPFSLEDVIDQAVQLAHYKAEKEDVRIHFERPRRPLIFTGAPFKFHQIVINLLTNAIDAYRDIPRTQDVPRTVTIRAERKRDLFVLVVKDRGCGISQDIQEKIFMPFFTTKRDTQGIGIGLAAIKRIVEEDLAGEIVVHCPRTGGTSFIVTFPAYPLRRITHAQSLQETIPLS